MSGLFQIGSITSGYRPIKNGAAYDKYFPKPGNEDRIIIEDGDVDDTVELMKKVVWKYIDDTKGIAIRLNSISRKQIYQNIWEFLYNHIQYKLDEQGLEQLRRPARSWADRESGIDCDCFSIFCSSILTNLKIPHKFRITKYDGPNFQHVYVVVPDGKGEIIIDPVLSKFNYEKPYSAKKDIMMNLSGINVAVLSGINGDLENVLFGLDLGDSLGSASEEEQLQAMYKYLVSTRNVIAQNPTLIQHSEDPEAYLKMLDYAIQYWNTDKRDEAMSILAMNEIDLNNKKGLTGDNGLGSFKSFFKKVGDFAKTTVQKVSTAAKTVTKAIVKYNPLTAAARGGLLLAFKLNLKKMGSKIKWAYGTQAQAAKAGISAAQYNRARIALQKIESLFVDKIQGNKNALRDAILKGRAGGLNGFVSPLGELGEPITMTAAIAAATPLIIATIKIMKDSGLFAPGEDTSTNNLVAEANNASASNTQTNSSSLPQTSYTDPTDIYSEGIYDQSILPDNSNSPSSNTGSFIKNNPIMLVAGAGVIGVTTYLLLRPKAKKKPSLSGVRKARSRSTSQNSRKPAAKGKRIQRVIIK